MIKKTIKNITLTGAMLITLASFTTKADAANATGIVTANSLNVRSGASTSYSIIGKLTKGKEVEILSSSNGWYKIQYSENQSGWVSADYISLSSNTSDKKVVKTLNVKAYAYTGDGITATGTVPKYGTIAVDPTVIPYGTKVYIKELDKVFTAEDCGGAIKGNTIDIFMTTDTVVAISDVNIILYPHPSLSISTKPSTDIEIFATGL